MKWLSSLWDGSSDLVRVVLVVGVVVLVALLVWWGFGGQAGAWLSGN